MASENQRAARLKLRVASPSALVRSWAAAAAGQRSTAYLPRLPSVPEEISSLRSRQRRVDRRRREALDRLVDLKGSVRVFCRVRPLVHTNSLHAQSPVTVEQERITVRAAEIKKEFGADRVFGQESTQEDVFEEVKPILRSALDGHNVCILAYGQTGTGKTYTMFVGWSFMRAGLAPSRTRAKSMAFFPRCVCF
uniref:Kinesin motor domain-containing protein n=2 Tax=Zea mays TaxID=4577 RepID=A0A804LZV1_MAIZE